MVNTPKLWAWKSDLQRIVETGDIPPQKTLDDWANDHSMGLIKAFSNSYQPRCRSVDGDGTRDEGLVGPTLQPCSGGEPRSVEPMVDDRGPGSALALRP
jgi:hypothetical protein